MIRFFKCSALFCLVLPYCYAPLTHTMHREATLYPNLSRSHNLIFRMGGVCGAPVMPTPNQVRAIQAPVKAKEAAARAKEAAARAEAAAAIANVLPNVLHIMRAAVPRAIAKQVPALRVAIDLPPTIHPELGRWAAMVAQDADLAVLNIRGVEWHDHRNELNWHRPTDTHTICPATHLTQYYSWRLFLLMPGTLTMHDDISCKHAYIAPWWRRNKYEAYDVCGLARIAARTRVTRSAKMSRGTPAPIAVAAAATVDAKCDIAPTCASTVNATTDASSVCDAGTGLPLPLPSPAPFVDTIEAPSPSCGEDQDAGSSRSEDQDKGEAADTNDSEDPEAA